MMTRFAKALRVAMLAAVTLLLPSLAGCTHNDGDLGPWFGYWRVEKVTADNTPVLTWNDPDAEGNYTFAFQNDILKVTLATPLHDYTATYASWSETDGGSAMTINYTHSAPDSGYEGMFRPFAVFRFPTDAPFTAKVSRNGDTAILTYTGNDGKPMDITLKKAY